MKPSFRDLAERFRAVLDNAEAGRAAMEAKRERALAEAREARRQLLEELAVFAKDIGHLDVQLGDGALRLRYGKEELAFVEEGIGDRIQVQLTSGGGEAPPIAVYRVAGEPQEVWVLSVGGPGTEAIEPLFDAGLVHLLVEGLGLPNPAPGSAGQAQPPLDALVPSRSGDDHP
jgi:hypothetical protein